MRFSQHHITFHWNSVLQIYEISNICEEIYKFSTRFSEINKGDHDVCLAQNLTISLQTTKHYDVIEDLWISLITGGLCRLPTFSTIQQNVIVISREI